MNDKKIAIIIGAGPAGLTAAYELLKHSENILPIVLEKSNEMGGLSKTVNYKGNLMDLGGHRFFSKSDLIMDWWQKIMPIDSPEEDEVKLTYQNTSKKISVNQNLYSGNDRFLIRNRKSRIYFLNNFFDYPLKLNSKTLRKLGVSRTIKIFSSYLKSYFFPIKEEKNLKDFFLNRFGYELYQTFFKDYTEKVWGVSCEDIPAEWGRQRIKKLNIRKVLIHSFTKKFKHKSISQKDSETSLIEKFIYPEYGPGQLWTKVSDLIIQKGGEIHKNHELYSIEFKNDNSIRVSAKVKNRTTSFSGHYLISTMPVKDLINSIQNNIPQKIKQIANSLSYRDFITVGLLTKKLSKKDIDDNWIYIQEKKVKLGRLQIYNNWSLSLLNDKSKFWLGLEYFCNENDSLWSMSDQEFIEFSIRELEQIKIINSNDVIDSTIIRVKKAYPSYFGSYTQFDSIKNYLESYPNLYLIGRNGMHKYNNQDHSMLTAITAVKNIINNRTNNDNIWSINTEQEYQE